MAAITIKDLPASHVLDRQAMSSIRGGGAPWVFGWIRPFIPNERSFAGGNLIEVTNIYADQIVNQIQVVDVRNSGAGSVINVGLDQKGANGKTLPSAA